MRFPLFFLTLLGLAALGNLVSAQHQQQYHGRAGAGHQQTHRLTLTRRRGSESAGSRGQVSRFVMVRRPSPAPSRAVHKKRVSEKGAGEVDGERSAKGEQRVGEQVGERVEEDGGVVEGAKVISEKEGSGETTTETSTTAVVGKLVSPTVIIESLSSIVVHLISSPAFVDGSQRPSQPSAPPAQSSGSIIPSPTPTTPPSSIEAVGPSSKAETSFTEQQSRVELTFATGSESTRPPLLSSAGSSQGVTDDVGGPQTFGNESSGMSAGLRTAGEKGRGELSSVISLALPSANSSSGGGSFTSAIATSSTALSRSSASSLPPSSPSHPPSRPSLSLAPAPTLSSLSISISSSSSPHPLDEPASSSSPLYSLASPSPSFLSSLSPASLASAESASLASAASSATPSAFEMPGQRLSVLPIGLGVLGGIILLGLSVVGYVTWERRRYRALFRRRRAAQEKSQERGLGGDGLRGGGGYGTL